MKFPIFFIATAFGLLQPAFGSDLAKRAPDAIAHSIANAPQIDGALTDPVWLNVAEKPGSVLSGWRTLAIQGQTVKMAPQQRIVYLAWDKDALYIAMQAYVTDLGDLRVDGAGNIFLGDCLEVHLNVPDVGYFQLGLDFQGNFSPGEVPPGVDVQSIKAKTDVGDNFWTAEIAVPWSVLGITPKAGTRLGVAFSANHATQDDVNPNVLTRIHWGKSYGARKFESILELQ